MKTLVAAAILVLLMGGILWTSKYWSQWFAYIRRPVTLWGVAGALAVVAFCLWLT
jgi:hypothetical protein